jgi:hypothetical protein
MNVRRENLTPLERIDKARQAAQARQRTAEVYEKKAHAAALAAIAEQEQIEADRIKIMEGAAAGARYGMVFSSAADFEQTIQPVKVEVKAPAPELPSAAQPPLDAIDKEVPAGPDPDPDARVWTKRLKKPVAGPAAKQTELIISSRMPILKKPKSQGPQPGRKVPHVRKTVMLEIPWPDLVRGVLFHVLGCKYAPPIVGFNQTYVKSKEAQSLLLFPTKRRGQIIRAADLALEINIPYSILLSFFAALRRIPWSMRLVRSVGLRGWALCPYARGLLDQDFATITRVVDSYVQFWPNAWDLKKTGRDRALYIGNSAPRDTRAIIRVHAELGIEMEANPRPPMPPTPLLKSQVATARAYTPPTPAAACA